MERLQMLNLFAGPSAGKSTTAAGVYSKLKKLGQRIELITEVAKDATWEHHNFILTQQVLLFAEQLRRQTRLIGQRAVAVTDSPILLPGLVYNEDWMHLPALTWEAWDRFDNINFFIERVKPYDPEGRGQDEGAALEKDDQTREMLDRYGIEYTVVPGDEVGENLIVSLYMEKYRKVPLAPGSHRFI